MKVSERKYSDVTVLDVSGKVTIGEGDIRVRDAVLTALAAGARKILLNLNKVTRIDSAGVGELVAAYTTVTNRGGQLKMLRPPAAVENALQITQVISLFEVFDTEAEAVASFG